MRVLFLFLTFLSCTYLSAEPCWNQLTEDIFSPTNPYSLTAVTEGASNYNYRFEVDGKQYLVRRPPEIGQAPYADPLIERFVLQHLSPLNVSPYLHYFNPSKHVLVMDYLVHDKEKIDLFDPVARKAIFSLLHKIEQSEITITRTFKPHTFVQQMLKELPAEVGRSYEPILPLLEKIELYLNQVSQPSLCHLDLHKGNIIKSKNQYFIIDWEYAMMSHRYLSLASMASIERWNDDQMYALLKDYQPTVTSEDFEELYLCRIAIDVFWSVWNLIQEKQSPLDCPYKNWSDLFYEAAFQRASSQTKVSSSAQIGLCKLEKEYEKPQNLLEVSKN